MTQKKRKIAILGTGNVGATIAYNIMLQGLFSEILLVDINKDKAEAEALDLCQCAACVPSCKVWSGEYSDVKGADIVVVTFGIARRPDQTRLDLAKTNIGILKSVIPSVAKIAPQAIYIMVSNPVDLMTYTALTCTNLSPNQVIGTGTLLDSNRLSQAIANYCKVDITNVTSYVLGEHGDACMVPWSLCTVAGMPIKKYCTEVLGIKKEKLQTELDAIYAGMVKSGSKVIKGKGATFYAIAASVSKLVKAIIANTGTILPLSTMLNGEYGANGICLGVPAMVDGTGLKNVVKFDMTVDEKESFAAKVAAMNKTYEALGLK